MKKEDYLKHKTTNISVRIPISYKRWLDKENINASALMRDAIKNLIEEVSGR